ncbi:uncharacterized protein [Dermacentor albipictus]|uniref:uncharacterized protein isoform X2 n=1 Tax=Dermacentor albipictus TaxID=60249 RepID=UPI0031FC73F3
MSTYSPFMAAPLDVLAQRLEVLECVGYHCVYKYGRVNSMEMTSDFDPPFTSGITFRVFFYRPDDNSSTYPTMKLKAILLAVAVAVLWTSASAATSVESMKEPQARANTEEGRIAEICFHDICG